MPTDYSQYGAYGQDLEKQKQQNGGVTPQGASQRPWGYQQDPNAFQYGGRQGFAQDEANFFRQQGLGAQNRAGVQIDPAAYNLMQQAALGNAPSQAALQQQQGLQQSIAAQQAMAASARGGAGLAGAQFQASQNAAGLQNQAVNQAAQLRAQEMANARGQYGMGNQVNQAQLGAQMQGQMLALQAERERQMAAGRWSALDEQRYEAEMKNAIEQDQQTQGWVKTLTGVAGGIGSGVASVFGFSDERLKTDVEPGGKKVDAFLSMLKPYEYRYKEKKHEPSETPNGGWYLGVMAQNVEKSDIGKQFVRDLPEGKALEIRPLVSAMAGGLGRLHERLSKLESKK
jgi:hypothetical protein